MFYTKNVYKNDVVYEKSIIFALIITEFMSIQVTERKQGKNFIRLPSETKVRMYECFVCSFLPWKPMSEYA